MPAKHDSARRAGIALAVLLGAAAAGGLATRWLWPVLGCDRFVADAFAGEEPDGGAALRQPTEWRADRDASGAERDKGAHARREALVRRLLAHAGVSYPPAELLFRGFKDEDVLEVWAAGQRGEAMRHVASYRVCSASGALGPKRREGDRQVPEGFYRLAHFNPQSRFHLSFLVSYPNESDRKLGDPRNPGGEIMIHGDCRSRGCLAMSDERIEELWVMARASKARPTIFLFPSRDIDGLLKKGEMRAHHAFWKNLAEGLAIFERTKRPPGVRVDFSGRYLFDEP